MLKEIRRSKATIAAGDAFVARVRAYILDLGAYAYIESLGVYAIQTRAGRLEISPRADFIPTRFCDVVRARALLGVRFLREGRLNPYSGKWNFGQGELFGVKALERPPIESKIFAAFRAELEPIVVPGPVDAPSWGPWDQIELDNPY